MFFFLFHSKTKDKGMLLLGTIDGKINLYDLNALKQSCKKSKKQNAKRITEHGPIEVKTFLRTKTIFAFAFADRCSLSSLWCVTKTK